jgi:quinol monooxygenase YgiN
MSSPFDIIAIITPKAGKADRVCLNTTAGILQFVQVAHDRQVEELLAATAKDVKANEPGVLRYHLQREVKGDAPTFVMLET